MNQSVTTFGGEKTRVASLSALFQKHFLQQARAWRVSPWVMGVIVLIPFGVALTGALTALLGKDAYKWFTSEDGFAESLQVLFYFSALVICLVITRWQWKSGDNSVAMLYAGLSLGLFFLTGEELNWGQRMFGWGTAESFAEINKQGETNLHNIYGVGATFKWIQLLVGAYGTILPLAVLRWSVPDRLKELVAWIIPPVSLTSYFIFLFVWRLFRNFMEEPEGFYFVIAEYNEVMELILAMGFLLFMVYQWRQIKSLRSI
jgi:hypothetical protein